MKLELKNIKVSRSLSEETLAYTATLYVDGKRTGRVSNHGMGGNSMIRPYDLKQATKDRLAKAIKTEVETPKMLADNYKLSAKISLEDWCDFTVSEWDSMTEVRSKFKTHLVFSTKNPEEVLLVKVKGGVKSCLENHPGALRAAILKHSGRHSSLLNTNIPKHFN